MKTSSFWLAAAVIFILDQLLSLAFNRPVPVFGIFLIFYLLTAADFAASLGPAIGASLVFDFFSGLDFGVLTGLALVTALSIYFVRQYLVVAGKSWLAPIGYVLIFVWEYQILLAFWLRTNLSFADFLNVTWQSALIIFALVAVLTKIPRLVKI